MAKLRAFDVDERDSTWESLDARFRVYIFGPRHGSGADGRTTGWSTRTIDLVGGQYDDAVALATRECPEGATFAIALVSGADDKRGLTWLHGCDLNENPSEERRLELHRSMLRRLDGSTSVDAAPTRTPVVDEAFHEVEVLDTVTDADARDIAGLLGQLSATAAFDPGRLAAMVVHEATELLAVRVDGRIVGVATLVTFPLPSGRRGHIDDVVVDESMRGRGIARALLHRMTELATERGLRTLDLTSRPERASARRLYESVGFVRRETDAFRFVPPRAD